MTIDQLQNLMDCRNVTLCQLAYSVEVTTAILDRHGDHLQFYVYGANENSKKIVISDGGFVLNELRDACLLDLYGLGDSDGCIRLRDTVENLAVQVKRLVAFMQAVNSLLDESTKA